MNFRNDSFLKPLAKIRCWVSTVEGHEKINPFIGLEDGIDIPRLSQTTKDSSLEDYFKNRKGVPI